MGQWGWQGFVGSGISAVSHAPRPQVEWARPSRRDQKEAAAAPSWLEDLPGCIECLLNPVLACSATSDLGPFLSSTDVDDLDDASQLEIYVGASQAVLIFLSKGYFNSVACLRELDTAIGGKKTLILVHEIDVKHGGASLETLKADCLSKATFSEALFGRRGPEIISWYRVGEFQQLSRPPGSNPRPTVTVLALRCTRWVFGSILYGRSSAHGSTAKVLAGRRATFPSLPFT